MRRQDIFFRPATTTVGTKYGRGDMTEDRKNKKREQGQPNELPRKIINVQENRFIDAGADSLIWPDKPVELTEREKLIQAAMVESIKTKRPWRDVFREYGLEEYL